MQPYWQLQQENLELRESLTTLRQRLDGCPAPCRPASWLCGKDDAPAGQTLFATVLFVDIVGFSGLSRALGPQATVDLLNQYFTLIVACIERQGGRLDKFIGDGAMAVFGVPRPAGDDEDRALRAALAMIEALAGWNRVRRRQRLEPIEIRIGINSDRVFWGGIGAPQRRDVTVIGEGVNLAARLERACKHYHARILISGGTRRRLQGRYRLRLADHLLLPGESRPTTVYEVLDYHSERSFPQMAAVLRHYRRGLACIRGRRFADAVRAFDQALALNPQDPLAQLHRSRCLACLERPPVAL